ncbi:CsbD family protein [Salsuginibacillus kocurii]|uniref:CsbD family protein n=1 Tax=Salsuginibacillus kocurii TaxID=427078 RepID=UPI00036A896F|nr:CsbD family protein [Salsuginibacillus kocurii]
MNREDFHGKWNKMSGEAKRQWSKLTDDDVRFVDGNRDKLIGKLQDRYNYSEEEAEREVDSWINKISL